MASQGLRGPLATVDATIGAKDRMITAPSNTWGGSIPELGVLVAPNQSQPLPPAPLLSTSERPHPWQSPLNSPLRCS